jgi:hypothetical protein
VKLDKMINQMETIIARDNLPEYRGDRDMLTKEIEEFEGMIKA